MLYTRGRSSGSTLSANLQCTVDMVERCCGVREARMHFDRSDAQVQASAWYFELAHSGP